MHPGRIGSEVDHLSQTVQQFTAGGRVRGVRIRGGYQILHAESGTGEIGRSGRNRLDGRSLLARNLAGRHRPFDDFENRFAGFPIQQKQVAGLGGEGHGRRTVLQLEQARRRRRVVIPQVMMNRLEMPDVFAGMQIHGNDGIGVQVVSRPVAAPGEGNRRGERQKDHGAFRVGSEIEGPGIGAQPPAPTVAGPGRIGRIARLRDRGKLP